MTRLRRSAGRRRAPMVLALVIGLLLGGTYVGDRAWSVRSHLTAAVVLLERLQNQVRERDLVVARSTLSALQAETKAARSSTAALDWRLGGRLPLVGPDVRAIRTVSRVVDDIAREVLPELVDVAGSLTIESLAPRGGRIDVAPLRAVASRLAAADAAARRADARLAAIPVDALARPLRSAIDQLTVGTGKLLTVTGSAARAAVLLPAMLGLDGPRTYLIIFQNPAEARATGGMPGAFAIVRAERGTVQMVDQGSASADLGAFEQPVLPLDPAMRALYTDRLGTFPADVNLTPHFPTSAALIREMYRLRSGSTVDGVLSVDPVALSYLLRATGPVHIPAGPALTAESAVRALLVDAYAQRTGPGLSDVREKERFFATAARAVFETLNRGAVRPAEALTALARAAGEHRLLLWSARAAEQEAIAGTTLEGALPIEDGENPTVGLFLNDGSGAKLSYYLTGEARLASARCLVDGRRELRLRVIIGSDAPVSGLPDYVLGMRLAGDPYTVRTQVLVFSPTDGGVVDISLDGTAARFGAGTERRRSVGVLFVDLKPGQRRTIEVTLLTGAPGPAATGRAAETRPRLWISPGARPWATTADMGKICG